MSETKWGGRSRRLWAWALGIFAFVATIDAATLDLVFPLIAGALGIDVASLEALRTRILSISGLAAIGLAWWRARRPDDRVRTVLPAAVRDVLPLLLLLAAIAPAALAEPTEAESIEGYVGGQIALVSEYGWRRASEVPPPRERILILESWTGPSVADPMAGGLWWVASGARFGDPVLWHLCDARCAEN